MNESKIDSRNVINGRINYIDTAKAIGICLVILGHAAIPIELETFICSFHMPLFFLLTGLTFKPCEAKLFFKKRVVSLIIPYVFFSILFVIKDLILYCVLQDKTPESIIKECFGVFCAMSRQSDYSIKPLWFLPCIFVCEALLFASIKLLKNNKPLILLTSVLLCFLSFFITEKFYLHFPWYIDVAAVSIIFMAVGYVFKDKINAVITNLNVVKTLILGVIALLACALVSHYNYVLTNKVVKFAYSEFANLFLTIAAAFLGITAVLAFASKCNSKISLYVGKNSLFIYGIHFFLYIYRICMKVYDIISLDIQENSALCILTAVILSMAVLSVCCVLAIPYNAVMNKVKEKLLS